MKNKTAIVVVVLALLAASFAAGAQTQRASVAESWIRWPWRFPCLRIFGCYPPELPPLIPPTGPNVPGPACGPNLPC